MDQTCIGIEPRPDGSLHIATQRASGVTEEDVEAGPTQSSRVVDLVRRAKGAARVCISAQPYQGLSLALAIATIEDAEVMLMRPDAVSSRLPLARALASYARRAA